VPFIQLSIFLAPSFFVGTIPGVVMLTAVTIGVVLCVAAVSWHVVEKPVLSLRRFALTGRATGEGRAVMAPVAAVEGVGR